MAACAGALGFGPRVIFLPQMYPTLTVVPPSIELDGPESGAQLVATLRSPDGSQRDVTAEVSVSAENDCVQVSDGGFIRARRDGATSVIVTMNERQARVGVIVRRTQDNSAVSFRRDVVAALGVGGCNQGACHGTPSGKNGFALSLRGSDPTADFRTLTRDYLGRRTWAGDADSSLLLRKGMGVIPHEGGVHWRVGSLPAARVRHWLQAGCPDDPPSLAIVTRLEVLPSQIVLTIPGAVHALAVHAHFSDGTARDVTRLCAYSSSRPAIAEVGETGRVRLASEGEAAILVRYLEAQQVVHFTAIDSKREFTWSAPPETNEIDRLVFAKLRQLQLRPAGLCSDATFLRRVTLDLTGSLPTPAEARAFLNDPSPNKRERAIDRLLDSPLFADYWAMKWADVLRVSRKSMHAKGAAGLHQWLRTELAANAPFDQIVRQLLTATGSSALIPPANFYRAVRDASSQAEAVAQVFCGVRLQCAKCHNHPSDRWTQDDYSAMTAFFARVRIRPDSSMTPPPKDALPSAEVVYLDRNGESVHPRTGQPVPPRPLGGAPMTIDGDRRAAFADWLVSPTNPFFSRSVVNRTWFHLFGRGIVDPVDDFRDSNPPSHPELLDYLASEFSTHRFELRRLLRLVLNSSTYQLDSTTGESRRGGDAYFARSTPRLLTAEQLLDAIGDVMESPERFAGAPANRRAIQLPDGDPNHPFLKAFGQPARELPCECERNEDSNIAQALQMVSGPSLHNKLRDPNNRIGRLLQKKLGASEIVEELTLAAYGRLPLAHELQAARDHLARGTDPRKELEDLIWAFLNSPEFLYRH